MLFLIVKDFQVVESFATRYYAEEFIYRSADKELTIVEMDVRFIE